VDPKNISFCPSYLSFINPEWPVKTWRMNATFEHGSDDDRLASFDLASPFGKIDRFPLSFPLPTRKRTPKLGSEPRSLALFQGSLVFEDF
jgi:hypothetical protein